MDSHILESFSKRVGAIASTYDTDVVLVLGKGPSVDDLDRDSLKGNFVVALNDASRFLPADVTLFHEEWAKDAIAKAGFQSKLYVTPLDFAPDSGEVVNVPYRPLANDEADIMMSRILNRHDFALEEVMLLSALEIARIIADERRHKQTVYLLGFDFNPERGFSKEASGGFEPGLDRDRSAGVEIQEHFLRNALYMLKESVLDVVHVGNLDVSRLSVLELNAKFSRSPGLAPSTTIADEHEVLITAEITTNHFGDRNRLERLIREAHAAGADLVKLQKRNVDTFYSPEQLAAPYVSPFGSTFGDYRRALELDEDDFRFVEGLTRELGIRWFTSILDEESFRFMSQFDMAAVKLPSTISEHTNYLSLVAQTYTGPLVLSTGMTDQAYEGWVLRTFGAQQTLYLMHANSAYPTPDHDCNVGVVRHYSMLAEEHPNIIPAYSSHDFGWMASALAVAAGARMVEKHVKLGNTDWAHFDAVAVDLTTTAFKEYVENVRRAQTIAGSSVKRVTASEHHKYTISK